MSREDKPGLLRALLNSAAAACIAEGLTLPLDTAKVRLQLQTISGGSGEPAVRRYKGPFHTVRTIIKEEGLAAPFKGLVPGLQRQIVFTGLRLGLYDHVRTLFAGPTGDVPLYGKVAAALATSAIAITAAQPADLVKVRFQASETPSRLVLQRKGSAAVADMPKPEVTPAEGYRGVTDAYRRIVSEEGGLSGLYKGFHANLIRNSVISATELVSYDTTKEQLLRAGFPDNIGVHLMAGLSAGFIATTLGSPMDVVGTRLMASEGQQKGLLAFCVHLVQTEGVAALWKGFLPNFARVGSFNIVLWASYEQIKKL